MELNDIVKTEMHSMREYATKATTIMAFPFRVQCHASYVGGNPSFMFLLCFLVVYSRCTKIGVGYQSDRMTYSLFIFNFVSPTRASCNCARLVLVNLIKDFVILIKLKVEFNDDRRLRIVNFVKSF